MSLMSGRLSRRSALGLAAGLSLLASPRLAEAAPIVVTDVNGRTIPLPRLPERIVLGFHFEEFTAVAGPAGWDKVVGFSRALWAGWRPASFTRYAAVIPRLADMPDVGNTEDQTFSLEKVLALRPDLLILADWSVKQLGPQLAQLTALGIPTVSIDYNAQVPARHAASTRALGQATGNPARGEALAQLYTGKVADIERRVRDVPTHPKVYVELGQGGAETIGNTYSQTMWARILDLLRLQNIADGHIAGSWGPLNPEWVLAADPAAIFIAGSSWVNRPNAVRTGFDATLAETRATLAPYARRKGWAELTAIRTGQIFAIEHGLCRCLPDYAAMYYIGKQLFPDRFADIAPEEELRRYYAEWLPVRFSGTWMARLTPDGA